MSDDMPEYRAWVDHIQTCKACEEGTPEPGDEDYVCPEGKKLKAAWLDPDRVERSVAPTEFQLAVCQMLIKFASAAEGDPGRLAAMARAQVVAGQAARSLITRSQLLNKRWDAWTQAELLELVRTAENNDVAPGTKPGGN